MKNNYIVNEKSVKDIKTVQSRYSRTGYTQHFILDDNTEIKARGTKIQIQCHNCGKWKEFTYDYRYETKEYICTSCRYTGKNNPFYGKQHSKELKERLSAERKGIWGIGEKNAMFGKPCYYKMSKDEKQQWKDNIRQTMLIPGKSIKGKHMTDFMTADEIAIMKKHQLEHTFSTFSVEKQERIRQKQSQAQKHLQNKDPIAYSKMKAKGGLAVKSKATSYEMTKPEIKLYEFLKEHNVDFDYSCIMGSGEKCYQYDFIIHHKRILIEVQGNYWHGDPCLYNEDGSNGKKQLNNIQKKNIERDKLKYQFATDKNFTIIYIWESEINNNDFSKLKEIL